MRLLAPPYVTIAGRRSIPKLHAASTGGAGFHGRTGTGAAHNGRLFATPIRRAREFSANT